MRIYSMRATFGKLEQATLTLEPGLNVIQAPNEWGKSTWCAFLIAMLYGIDSRAKSTRSQLADKERFRPWSGSPMEGSIELSWKGRDITIQRWTRGRIPMGEFRAFETASGLEIPELDSENCGRLLLGVEKEVFTRAGFLRFSDLPVTEDEQLRRRLNALVTTGDESGSGQLLEQKLKEIKNRCRYNRSGLIPQARQQKEQLEQRMEAYHTLDAQTRQLGNRVRELEQQIRSLENHRTALRHAAGVNAAATLREAQQTHAQARDHFEALENQAKIMPTGEVAASQIQELTGLREALETIMIEEQRLPQAPSRPEPPQGFEGCTAYQAMLQARQHRGELKTLAPMTKGLSAIVTILAVCLLLLAPVLYFDNALAGLVAAGISLAALPVSLVILHRSRQYRRRLAQLTQLYGTANPTIWVQTAEEYATLWQNYIDGEGTAAFRKNELAHQKETLLAKCTTLSGAAGLSSTLEHWRGILRFWEEYADAEAALQQAEKHLQALRCVAVDTPPAPEEDTLTFSQEQTDRLLYDTNLELKQLLTKQGQLLGQLEALGSLEALEQENQAQERRILQLEQYYAASELALKALEQATAQLQRRFAPRISEAAGQILSRLTQSRYRRLTLGEDFSLQIGAEDETVLRSHHWRSDGTVDQLYLAVRLAVAQELMPQAPLVLDDALVRFDDLRLRAALEVLQEEAETKQVIVFTCQEREQAFLD